MEDNWIYDENNVELVNLTGLANVYRENDDAYDEQYKIMLRYQSSSEEVALWYKSEEQRDNMFMHIIVNLGDTTKVNSNNKPITL